MDQTLKARLIGAAVLVALAVLVIPELLSGRKGADSTRPAPEQTQGTRTYTIELGAPASSGGEILADGSDAATKLPAAVAPDAVTPSEAPASAARRTAEEKSASTEAPKTATTAGPIATQSAPLPLEPATSPTASTVSSTSSATKGGSSAAAGTWCVQVGAFGSSDAADKLARELDAAGYAAYVSATKKGDRTLHRVRVGAETTRASADSLAARLKARGLPATVVAN